MLSLGSKGIEVSKLQKLLNIEITGEFDEHTQAAVKNFQIRAGLRGDGIVGPKTKKALKSRLGEVSADEVRSSSVEFEDADYTTDLSETGASRLIHEDMMPSDEYVSDKGTFKTKKYIFIHHTAGWNNPFKTVQDWANDNRGRVGTHYVIGGINVKNHDSQHDGKIVKCIPDEYFAYHLGGYKKHGIDPYMHKHSVGIEICNFGWLSEHDGHYYTYTGQEVPEEYVCDLGYKFRGHRYYHKYTDEQITSLKYLIELLSEQFDIDIYNGLQERLETMHPRDAFDYYEEAVHGEVYGLLSHTNVRADKTDVSPQEHLITMIQHLNNRGSQSEYFSAG